MEPFLNHGEESSYFRNRVNYLHRYGAKIKTDKYFKSLFMYNTVFVHKGMLKNKTKPSSLNSKNIVGNLEEEGEICL